MRLLLESGADYLASNNKGYTILHVAADYRAVDVEMLNLLREARLKGLDVNATCHEGLTSSQLIQARDHISNEFRWCFVALLESVVLANPRVYGPKAAYQWPAILI